MDANLLSLFWEGFELESYEVSTANTALLRLKPRPSHVPRCGSCGQTVQRVHDVNRRRVRERDLFDHRVWLDVPVRRLRCAQCGIRREQISWLPGRRGLTQAMHGIVASAVYRLNTSVLEGLNNRIKVIKRMAYGYRDSDYFFLKIKAAFPGKAR